jgi:3-methyladenine DNA glycosylase AlkD
VQDWIDIAKPILLQHARPELAPGMAAYMKNRFPFLGIQSNPRKACLQTLKKELGLPNFEEGQQLLPLLMKQPAREWHYLAIDIAIANRYYKHPAALPFFETLMEQHTWWDSVDPMAVHCFGKHLLVFPELIPSAVEKWTHHPNFWYQRLSMLYCLKHKTYTNFELLLWSITQLANSKEFFVQKGMGWVLREHSKSNPEWVQQVLATVPVSKLTFREASKYLSPLN